MCNRNKSIVKRVEAPRSAISVERLEGRQMMSATLSSGSTALYQPNVIITSVSPPARPVQPGVEPWAGLILD
jgi:hypothetical protein